LKPSSGSGAGWAYPKLPALAVAIALERDIARQTITDTSAPEVAATAV